MDKERLQDLVTRFATGGFQPLAFLSILTSRRCSLCSKIPDRPMFLEYCGHRYCRNCAILLLVGSNRSNLGIDTLRQVVDDSYEPTPEMTAICVAEGCSKPFGWTNTNVDAAFNKQLSQSKCKCVSKNCSFSGSFPEYKQHLMVCEFSLVDCYHCHLKFHLGEVRAHSLACKSARVEPDHTVTCNLCHNEFLSSRLDEHQQNECELAEATCQYCFERVIRKQMNHHMETCTLTTGKCPFGCRVVPNTNAKEHYVLCEFAHMKSLQMFLSAFDDKTEEVIFHVLSAVPIEQLKAAFPNIVQLVAAERQKNRLIESPDNFSKLLQLYGPRNLTIQSVKTSLSEKQRVLDDIEDSLSPITVIVSDVKKMGVDNKKELASSLAKEDKLSESLDMDSIALKVVKRQIDHLDSLVKNGILTWRIAQWSKICEDLQKQEDKSILSASFYTSESGYKLRLKLFPLGVKSVYGEYMSLYVVICRGEYDAIVQWPFSRVIEVSVLDQRCSLPRMQPETTGKTKFQHLTFTIDPEQIKADAESVAPFERPSDEANPGFGVINFLKLQNNKPIGGGVNDPVYLDSDVLYIRASVYPFDVVEPRPK